MPEPTTPDAPTLTLGAERRLERSRDGRWLAGVCAGLARFSGRRVGTIRLAFVLATPFFGITPIAYLACWLILPEAGGRERRRVSALSSALVSVVLCFGAALALLTLAVASAVATVFGLGWGVVVVAAAILLTGALWMRGSHPGWVLLPVAVLVLPAALITGLHLRLDRQIGTINVAPDTPSALRSSAYRTGLGNLFIDLRHYAWRPGTAVPLHIDAGLGRTVVALPHGLCVAVRVHYNTHAGVLHGVAGALGASADDPSALTVFGQSRGPGTGEVAPTAHGGVPVLTIDFSSEGGQLDVRDYPDAINPSDEPDWPGELFGIAPRPSLTGLSKAQARLALSDWRAERREDRTITRELPGPCSGTHRS
jgi:phage shock protein PspC (stress-responsive transcriptional regulator)